METRTKWELAGLGAFAVVMAIVIPSAPKPDAKASPSPSPTPTTAKVQPVAITAGALAAAFQENELTAAKRFAGKPIRLTGTIDSISSVLGTPTVMFRASPFVQASFPAEAAPALESLKSGQQATVLCRRLVEVASLIGLKDCSLN